jgi:hypothetical protein
MFVLTGVAHFVGKRAELVAMVPPFLPAPELLVTVTGVLELTGAVGLVWSRTGGPGVVANRAVGRGRPECPAGRHVPRRTSTRR